MTKVILTKGLPGSGKTTWAKQIISEYPNSYKRINKDDLRLMIDGGKFSKDAEKFILKVRDILILEAIADGKHVIIDDTNLHPKHEINIRKLVKGKAEVVIQDFANVSIETCIKQDLKRFNSVGEKVIREMHKQFLKETQIYTENKDLPKAIIVDLDGTLAIMDGRSPYEWDRVEEDSCNNTIKEIVNKYQYKVIIVSGRDEVCRVNTGYWLVENNINCEKLFMRPEGNSEKDSTIKRRIFENEIRGKYFIEYVLDDRNSVVDMWRSLGLICLQVAEGDF